MADNQDQPTVDEPITETEVAEEQAEVAVEEVMAETEAEATAEEINEAEEEASVAAGTSIPEFRAGDTLRLGLKIKEGEKTRTQYFEGIILGRKGAGVNKTFTIRKIAAGGIAVERIFPVLSPSIVSWEVRRRGVVRRAKIYFLRDIVGSTANVIKERKVAKEMLQVQEARKARKAAKVEKKAAKPAAVKKTVDASTRSAKRASRKTT